MTTEHRKLAATLTDIARDIATLQSPDLLLSSISRRARLLLGTDIAYLSLNDPHSGETVIRSNDGVRTDAYAAITMPLGTGVLGLAAGGVIAETPDYLPDEGKTHLPDVDRVVQDEGVRAILGAPLRVAGKILGALMAANRTPGPFSATQREHIEHLAGLAAAAVELVTAKQNEAAAHAQAAQAVDERDRLLRADRLRAKLDERLSSELAEHRGPDDILAVAASITGTDIRVLDATGEQIAASPRISDNLGDDARAAVPAAALSTHAPLIGDAAPGTVVVHHTDLAAATATAEIVARYASIALLYDRTIDDVRHFHENELVNALLTPGHSQRPAPTSPVIQRSLGTDRPTCVAVLAPADPDGTSRRRLLARVRTITRRGNTIVANHLGRVVIITRNPADQLTATLGPLVRDIPYFGGIAQAPELAKAPGAYAEAAAIAAAMRALRRPGMLARTTEAGVAGLLLRDGDEATARHYLATHLGPLLDLPRSETLLTTALAYLDENASVNNTAERLHLHPNTVRQRIERIDAALTRNWRHGPVRLDTHVALRLWQVERLVRV